MPYSEDPFAVVDWRHRGRYMESRRGVSPAVVAEALADPARVVLDPDYNSVSGRTVRIIAASASLGDLITVIVLRDDGVVHGVNGWRSNERDRRIYRGGEARWATRSSSD